MFVFVAALIGCTAARMNAEPTIPIPASADGSAASGHRQHLSQPWNQAPDAGLQPGSVRTAWTPSALIVEADLTDSEVMTAARDDNEKLWELGDTFEMFLKLPGETRIAELHVAPNNTRLHLGLPGPRGRATPESRPLQFDAMCVSPVGFTSSVTRLSKGWVVRAAIPPAVFGLKRFEQGQQLRVSFCRYDASTGQKPVLSTTASHPVIDFHRPHEWTLVVLK